jgi:hypothetical protein
MSQPESDNDHGKPKTVHIIVNGRPREVEGPNLTYAQAVAIAYPDDPNASEFLYDIHYVGPHVKDGTLVAGQSVAVVNGMKFDVVRTNRS